MEIKHPLRVGSCLQYQFFEKEPNQIIKVEYKHDKWWYYIRSFKDGHLTVIPEGYIPYSYSVIECPAQRIPSPPPIRVGDHVEWDKGRGIVKAIEPDGTVKVETERKILGVRGIAYPDIYELQLKPREVPKLLPNTRENLYWWTVEQLRAECRKRDLPDYGHKKELIDRLSPGMGLKPPYPPKAGMVWDPIGSKWVEV